MTQGYTVIHGGMLSGDEWANVKRAGAALPAGQVTPSPKPYSPGGKELKFVKEADWTPGIREVVRLAREVAREILGVAGLQVDIVSDVTWSPAATYGRGGPLVLNLGRLGHRWFDEQTEAVEALLIHEFAHHYEGNHLSEDYFEACCDVGARLARLALSKPDVFLHRTARVGQFDRDRAES